MGNINVSRQPSAGLRGVIAVLGAPASGKTTIARRLSQVIGCGYVDAGELAKEGGLSLGMDEERGSLIINEEAVRERIEDILSGEGCLIVETVSPHVIPTELLVLVVVVRCRPSILLSRLRARGYPGPKIRENVEYEAVDGPIYDALEIADEGRVVEVDGCEGNLESEVELVMRAIGGKGVLGRFNWAEDFMSILDTLGRLGSYQ